MPFSSVLLLLWAQADPAGEEFFEKRVRPLLAERCFTCHSASAEKLKGNLRLDSREGVLKGGDVGPAVTPGDPEKSLLVRAVRWIDDDLKMPPKKKLDPRDIADLEAWVRMGLPYPSGGPGARKGGIDLARGRAWWAFQPPRVLPGSIDRFVLATLGSLKPAPPADPRTLIRRATFDLTGLPPAPEEVEAFVRDPDYEKLLDRLLARPAYGERWGRHWLDVVRYADSFDARGLGGAGDIPEAYRYRDWVVDAFNRDLPFDRFITEQIAGDLLPFSPEGITATGVLAIGNWGVGDADKEKVLTDIVDDQIDLVGRAFLGLTLACARCHDHKFDPISTEDYYGLAGIFFSSHILPNPGPKTGNSEPLRIPLAPPARVEARRSHEAKIAELERALKKTLEEGAAAGGKAEPVLLPARVTDLARQKGVHAWKNRAEADTPFALANTTAQPVAFGTIRLPPRCVAVHPSPRAGVGVAWKCPAPGTVRVKGRVTDGDSVCGDGVEWVLSHAGREVAKGAIANGGSEAIAEQPLEVKAGDALRLAVLPKREYTCDTTVVELEVAADGRAWNLARDVIDDFHQGNPHPSGWSFFDLAPELSPEARERVALLRARIDELKRTMPPPVPVAHGIQEGGTPKSAHEGFKDARVHVRGRYDRLGAEVPRRFPRVLVEDSPPITKGSGRLELARWLSSPENPLTARVFVNRVWQHHFGEGIVRTSNNFGKLGTPPSHPELLDWLAREFVRGGGSVKNLHKTIMLSSTYRQSSVPDPATLKADPGNLLFGRMNRRRLEAEALRDAMLAVSGNLDPAMRGPAVRDLAGPRRTLYLMTIRSDRNTYPALFDAADPGGIVEARTVSTVAPQALFLLNHPFVLAQADALARRAAAAAGDGDAKVRWLYARLFGRPPTEAELRWGRSLGGEAYAHVLLLSNEFMFVD